jgi:hypothetical protein
MFTDCVGTVLDTNVFYSLAQNKYFSSYLKQKYGKLLASPLSAIEIIASSNPQNFEFHQAVIRTFADVDEILPSPYEHLTEAWEIPNYEPRIKVEDRVKPLMVFFAYEQFGDAESMVKSLSEEKNSACQFAIANMEELKKKLLPGYLTARKSGRMLQPNDARLNQLKENVFSKEYLDIFLNSRFRIALSEYGAMNLEMEPSGYQFNLAFERLNYYLRMYAGYLLSSFMRTPKHNDLIDRELLIYLGPNCKFLTHDKLWLEIAQEAKLGNAIIYLTS